MSISLCLIVKNEEKVLERCLVSFKGIYNDLVIVDTGSIDNTKNIAEKYNARIFDFKWIDDFSAARNYAISKAESDYIMMVDADDYIEEQDREKLIHVINEKLNQVDGFYLPYLLPSKNGDHKKSYFPKIWKSDLNLVYKQRIHEYLDITEEIVESFIKIEIPIKTEGDFADSFDRNLRILNQAIIEEPQNTRYLYYLGHDNQYSGHVHEAIYWYERFIDLGNTTNRDELNRVYRNKALCHLKLSETPEAVVCLRKAIETNPNFVIPYLLLGDIEMKRKNYESAVKYYAAANKCKPPRTHLYINESQYKDLAQKKLENLIEHYKQNAEV
ncbi:glycosyltransferase [Patescibacteria group bacterium]